VGDDWAGDETESGKDVFGFDLKTGKSYIPGVACASDS
jgi:hypothetical protein